MNTTEQSNATQQALRAQLLVDELSEAMRAALLSAQPAPPEPEWDYPADYCQGHEDAELLPARGCTLFCESSPVCDQARAAYEADRQPDPDRLAIVWSDTVKLGTVVPLLARKLVGPLMYADTNYHPLTDLGVDVLAVLRAGIPLGNSGGLTPPRVGG